MNKVLKIILVIVLIISAMFSSLMIHIYNTTSIDDTSVVGVHLTTDEIVMYDMYIYILCISTLLLAGYWCYKQFNNNEDVYDYAEELDNWIDRQSGER